MKKVLINIAVFCSVLTGAVSCNKYLDVVPDNIPTIDDAFSDRYNAMKFLATCYWGIPKSAGWNENPAMLGAIRAAQQTITFESYIYWSGEIGREFAQALAERAKAGVKVHVLLDWVGSQKVDDAVLHIMSDAGVAARPSKSSGAR